jgi:hypothetical protein
MKKAIVLLLACLSSGWLMANHWTPVGAPYEENMALTCVVQINGEEQATNALEVGVFCGEECRGSQMAVYFEPEQRYIYQITVFGEIGDTLTFKLFDHTLGQELDLTPPDALAFDILGYGTLSNPHVLHFRGSYNITASASPSVCGTVEGAGTYLEGSTCTLTAIPNPGYGFLNWTKDGAVVSTEAEYSFTVTEDASFVANFAIMQYQVTATANPDEAGNVTGGGAFTYGQTCTVTATTNEGYDFLYWANNGVQATEETTYTFTVTESSNCVAYYVPEETDVQITGVPSGWTWYNTFIEQDPIDGLQMLMYYLGMDGLQIKAQEGYYSYFPGYGWMGTLSVIVNEATYKISTNSPCMINMIGEQTMPGQHPITITYGWNWTGYPVNTSMSVTSALSGITPTNGDQVKAQNGYANYYSGLGWMGTLNTIMPGMGLLYKSNNSTPFTFVYPEGAKGETLQENITADNNHWVPDIHAYPDNMTVTAVIELDDEELQSENYELAAFVNGEVRGSARLMYIEPLDRYVAFLLVSGEKVTELSFGLYDTETGMERFDATTTLTYSNNAVVGSVYEPYVVSFRGTTGTDEFGSRMHIYPNPVSRGEMLTVNIPVEDLSKAHVEIVNALGMVIETFPATSVQAIAAPEVAGVYTLRVTVDGKGTYYRKLVVR